MTKEPVSPQSVTYIKPSPELEALQYLMPMKPDDRERLKKDIAESKEIRDAIKCYQDKEGYFLILAGLNRWEIAVELGIKTVPVQIYKGTTKEYRELVINDNLNRRHLSINDKKKIAAEFFKIKPERSANDVAKKTGLDDKTAGKVKKELQARSEIPNVITEDTKGRKQPDKKPKQKTIDETYLEWAQSDDEELKQEGLDLLQHRSKVKSTDVAVNNVSYISGLQSALSIINENIPKEWEQEYLTVAQRMSLEIEERLSKLTGKYEKVKKEETISFHVKRFNKLHAAVDKYIQDHIGDESINELKEAINKIVVIY